MASMTMMNDYSKQKLFQSKHKHLTLVLRHTWKTVKPSFKRGVLFCVVLKIK